MSIIIATGASGGHIFPALGLAEELKKDSEILFVCDRGRSQEYLSQKGYTVIPISVSRYRRGLRFFSFFFNLLKSLGESLSIINKLKPQAVVGFGSYAAFPVIVAAWISRAPSIIHEQNVFPGSANRLLAFFADSITVSFVESQQYFPKYKTSVTGCPIRWELSDIKDASVLQRFNLQPDRFTVLVLGGSRGSHAINVNFIRAIKDIKERNRMQVIHLTGKSDYEQVNGEYKKMGVSYAAFDFLEEMGDAYKSADVVVSRAGASVIAEITYFGKPAILIPYPFARSHQLQNAKVLAQKGAAILIEEKDLSPEILRDNLLRVMNNPLILKGMSQRSSGLARPFAARELGNHVRKLLR